MCLLVSLVMMHLVLCYLHWIFLGDDSLLPSLTHLLCEGGYASYSSAMHGSLVDTFLRQSRRCLGYFAVFHVNADLGSRRDSSLATPGSTADSCSASVPRGFWTNVLQILVKMVLGSRGRCCLALQWLLRSSSTTTVVCASLGLLVLIHLALCYPRSQQARGRNLVIISRASDLTSAFPRQGVP